MQEAFIALCPKSAVPITKTRGTRGRRLSISLIKYQFN